MTQVLHLPVDSPVKAIAPENPVIGHVQVQGHCVLLRGHHLAVVPLHRVYASDLMSVGEQEVRAFPCTQIKQYLGLDFGDNGQKSKHEVQVKVWICAPSKLIHKKGAEGGWIQWEMGCCFTDDQSNHFWQFDNELKKKAASRKWLSSRNSWNDI